MSAPRSYLASLEQLGVKLGLEQIRGLVRALDGPDRAFASIAVAGTNGKGSAAAMLERGLRAAGYRTGRYISPHLTRLEERFAVDGVDVAPATLDQALEQVRIAARSLPAPPSYFEATTAAALTLFRDAAIDVAVLEVGLGGRLDATNVVDSVASVITAIDFDHREFLGDTLEAIASEKAGVIKPASICVLADNPPAVGAVVARRCAEVGAELIRAPNGTSTTVDMSSDGRAVCQLRTPKHDYGTMTLALRGRHQVPNALAAVRLLEHLERRRVFRVSAEAIRTAVEQVVWPGRLELITIEGRPVLIDGAHNAAGAQALAAFLRETYDRPLPLVLGVMGDKDVAAIAAPLAAVASQIICTAAPSPRAMSPEHLARLVAELAPDVPVSTSQSPKNAIAEATAGSPVVVAGSLYLAGAVRSEIS